MRLLYINKPAMRTLGILSDEALPGIWEILADGLVAFGEGRANLPLDSYLRTPSEEQFDRIIAKPGVVGDIAGIKWIASAPLNTRKGLPRATGLLILNDVITGMAYAILDAVPVSNIRTAGCSMIFLKTFRPNFKRAVIVGAGVHGREHYRQLAFGRKTGHFPNLDEIAVYDMVPEAVDLFCRHGSGQIIGLHQLSDVAGDQTAVLFCTNALTPYVGAEHVKQFRGLTGNHMSLRDYTAEALSAFDHVVADSAKHVAKVKTSVDLAVEAGLLDVDTVLELPQLLIDRRAGKTNPFRDENNVVFNPMGLASHDLILGRHVYERAVERKTGIDLSV